MELGPVLKWSLTITMAMLAALAVSKWPAAFIGQYWHDVLRDFALSWSTVLGVVLAYKVPSAASKGGTQ